LQHEPELCAVGDYTVVDDAELAFGIGADWMAVDLRRGAMGSPASVCDGNLGYEGLVDIYRRSSDLFAPTGDFPTSLNAPLPHRYLTHSSHLQASRGGPRMARSRLGKLMRRSVSLLCRDVSNLLMAAIMRSRSDVGGTDQRAKMCEEGWIMKRSPRSG
jgi:hypothetical protein